MKHFYLLIALMLISKCIIAQVDYQTILPEEYLPGDFTQSSSFKYNMDISSISNEDRKSDRKSKQKFYLTSNFSIDGFLKSGKVLFNDPVSTYLNSVLYEVLKNDADLLGKVRVYAVKSTVPNAFATNSGIIFVNLGLLTKLKSEAQLAFILSHEVIHFREKHVINSYINNIEIEEGKGDFRGFTNDQQAIAKSSYSKELELEADTHGLQLYKNTAYKKDSIDKIFDILQISDQLILDQEFDFSFFEHGNYILPDNLKLKEFDTYVFNENYDDEKSTHPNSTKRKTNILELSSAMSKKSGEDFLISKTLFDKMQRIASYELCRQYLLTHQYSNALYLSYALLQNDAESLYLKKCIAKALYGSTYDNENKVEKVIVSPELQKIDNLLYLMKPGEKRVLALKYLYPLHEANPNDEELKLMVDDLISRLTESDKDVVEGLSFTKESTSVDDVPYYHYAFTEVSDLNALQSKFSSAKKPVKKTKNKSKNKSGEKVSKSLVMNPMYVKIDQRKKDAMRFADSEDVLTSFGEKVLNASDKLAMKNEVISTSHFNRNSIEKFQSHSILYEWLSEKFLTSDFSRVSPIHNEVREIATLHKTNHITWMGAVSLTQKVKGKGFVIAYTIFMPVILPFSAVYLLTPDKDTLYFSLTFNTATEQIISADVRQMSMKDTNSLLQSNIYYSLFKLKHGKK